MVVNWARKWGATIIEPIALFLARLGLTPNTITVLGFLMTAAVAVVLATGRTQLAGVLLIVTLAFDAVDGTLARLMGTASRFGAFLDSTLDRWAEVVLYGALVWLFLKNGQDNGVLLAVAAMATSLLVSYTRARAEGVGFQCKEGLLTRFERLVILIAGLIFNQVIWALAIIAILAGFTAVQRIWVTWQAARTEV
jgi:CDP-diacylglycerol--glycerol-3-phosphate 3-phosphatidyltransferase